MKVLTINFLTCAVKACKASSNSYPLHPKDAELVQDEIELNPDMIVNVLPRLDWEALKTTTSEVRSFISSSAPFPLPTLWDQFQI
jgi:multifunctional methyltransferase subunit TRM112